MELVYHELWYRMDIYDMSYSTSFTRLRYLDDTLRDFLKDWGIVKTGERYKVRTVSLVTLTKFSIWKNFQHCVWLLLSTLVCLNVLVFVFQMLPQTKVFAHTIAPKTKHSKFSSMFFLHHPLLPI